MFPLFNLKISWEWLVIIDDKNTRCRVRIAHLGQDLRRVRYREKVRDAHPTVLALNFLFLDRDHTEKLSPQPHMPVTFGLLNLNASLMPSRR